MNQKLYLLLSLTLFTSITYGQCDLNFNTGGAPDQFTFATQSGSDIVNGASSGAFQSSSQSFDIWDEGTNNCSTGGGVDDITFDFEMIHAFDQYGVDGIIDTYGGATHDIIQSGTGLAGGIPIGNSSTNESSTGDVRGYKITVTFAAHVEILAQDMVVNLTSANTAGGAHESSSLVFLDGSGTPYGTATYDGYYVGATGASTDGSCSVPAVRTNSWSVSATGAYSASSTVNIDLTDPCNVLAGSNGTNDNYDVDPVTDTGLNQTDEIGGFIFTVYLEDVAASSAPGANTTTSTRMTSTLNGITLTTVSLPVELFSFDAEQKNEQVTVDWSTRSEENNDYFELQWGTDGERFETIATVEGKGSDISISQYQYIHSNPVGGENYYRLKQVDYNRTFSYSYVRSVLVKKEATVLVYPTVVQDVLHVVKPEVNSTISVYNSNGILIRQIRDNKDDSYEVNVADLSAGSYIVTIQLAGAVFNNRFVKG